MATLPFACGGVQEPRVPRGYRHSVAAYVHDGLQTLAADFEKLAVKRI